MIFTCPFCSQRHSAEDACVRYRQAVASNHEAACSSCSNYTPVRSLKPSVNGGLICKRCDRIAKDKASERAQLAFFGQMDLI